VRHSRGRSRNFGKGGPVRGRSPKPSAEGANAGGGSGGPPPENFEKLDAISCNLAYIFGISMASDIIQNWAFTEQKTVAAMISIHIHTHTPPSILPKTPWISATIKSKFNFKNIFSDIVYNVKNKIDFSKNRRARGSRAPCICHCIGRHFLLSFKDERRHRLICTLQTTIVIFDRV